MLTYDCAVEPQTEAMLAEYFLCKTHQLQKTDVATWNHRMHVDLYHTGLCGA